MANLTFEAYTSRGTTTPREKKEYKVSFFSGLKNDGDEAIVRFAYDTPKDFEMQTVHVVKGKLNDNREVYRSISCLREGRDPLQKCPLCSAGEAVSTKFYAKFIEYVKDDMGRITPKAVFWERPATFAKSIVAAVEAAIDLGFCDSSVKISDLVFKIKRRGAKGDLKTVYEINPTNPMIYKPEIYTKDMSDFDEFEVRGTAFLEKDYDQMVNFIEDGILFPRKQSENTEMTATPSTVAETNDYTNYSIPSHLGSDVTTNQDQQSVNRPKRFTF